LGKSKEKKEKEAQITKTKMYPCMERRGVGEEGRRLPFFSDLLQSIY
jgi:hypothetical protein